MALATLGEAALTATTPNAVDRVERNALLSLFEVLVCLDEELVFCGIEKADAPVINIAAADIVWINFIFNNVYLLARKDRCFLRLGAWAIDGYGIVDKMDISRGVLQLHDG